MGSTSRLHSTRPRPPFSILPCFSLLALFSLSIIIFLKVEEFVSQTKTVAGHNLDPTPWHLFPPKTFDEDTKYARASKIIKCSYLTCHSLSFGKLEQESLRSSHAIAICPSFFRWIHRDLDPWARSKISLSTLMEAQKLAAFRVVIVGGRLYVDFYYACVQSRAMFTIWGFLQLLKRYPGLVPDVDLMFDCMDKPVVKREDYGSEKTPPPLFRYCTTEAHYDIPFPDWSFWGWPEVNLRAWNEEFKSIKKGSKVVSWEKKWPLAYWKGNPDVQAPVRKELMQCNDSEMWGAQLLQQNWNEEAKDGYEKSKLSNQCNHRYKIYAEGYAWSVSLKYILSCGSLALIISPQYEDFFSRGLVPKYNYWPLSRTDICPSIKFAVDWGNAHPSEAQVIGKRGQRLMEKLDMDNIYGYMFHLITEYSKLLDFKPSPPPSAKEMCGESLLCFADQKQRRILEKSIASPSAVLPCTLQPSNNDIIESAVKQKEEVITSVREMEKNREGTNTNGVMSQPG